LPSLGKRHRFPAVLGDIIDFAWNGDVVGLHGVALHCVAQGAIYVSRNVSGIHH